MVVKDLTYDGNAILAIDQDGFLKYFRYQGQGEENPSASTGFHPNSGNKIGNGW